MNISGRQGLVDSDIRLATMNEMRVMNYLDSPWQHSAVETALRIGAPRLSAHTSAVIRHAPTAQEAVIQIRDRHCAFARDVRMSLSQDPTILGVRILEVLRTIDLGDGRDTPWPNGPLRPNVAGDARSRSRNKKKPAPSVALAATVALAMAALAGCGGQRTAHERDLRTESRDAEVASSAR